MNSILNRTEVISKVHTGAGLLQGAQFAQLSKSSEVSMVFSGKIGTLKCCGNLNKSLIF